MFFLFLAVITELNNKLLGLTRTMTLASHSDVELVRKAVLERHGNVGCAAAHEDHSWLDVTGAVVHLAKSIVLWRLGKNNGSIKLFVSAARL